MASSSVPPANIYDSPSKSNGMAKATLPASPISIFLDNCSFSQSPFTVGAAPQPPPPPPPHYVACPINNTNPAFMPPYPGAHSTNNTNAVYMNGWDQPPTNGWDQRYHAQQQWQLPWNPAVSEQPYQQPYANTTNVPIVGPPMEKRGRGRPKKVLRPKNTNTLEQEDADWLLETDDGERCKLWNLHGVSNEEPSVFFTVLLDKVCDVVVGGATREPYHLLAPKIRTGVAMERNLKDNVLPPMSSTKLGVHWRHVEKKCKDCYVLAESLKKLEQNNFKGSTPETKELSPAYDAKYAQLQCEYASMGVQSQIGRQKKMCEIGQRLLVKEEVSKKEKAEKQRKKEIRMDGDEQLVDRTKRLKNANSVYDCDYDRDEPISVSDDDYGENLLGLSCLGGSNNATNLSTQAATPREQPVMVPQAPCASSLKEKSVKDLSAPSSSTKNKNDVLQPSKRKQFSEMGSGAVDIGVQALIESMKKRDDEMKKRDDEMKHMMQVQQMMMQQMFQMQSKT